MSYHDVSGRGAMRISRGSVVLAKTEKLTPKTNKQKKTGKGILDGVEPSGPVPISGYVFVDV